MILVKLFLAFLRVGLFAIGGAYSFLPLIEKEVVEKYQWLTKEEFLDVLGIVKIFPGAISIKYATYTGHKIAGMAGVVAANIGNLLAPALLIFTASAFYLRYRNIPAVKSAFNMIEVVMFVMLIAVAFQSIDLHRLIQVRNIAIIIITFILYSYTKIHPALIIISAGIVGALLK